MFNESNECVSDGAKVRDSGWKQCSWWLNFIIFHKFQCRLGNILYIYISQTIAKPGRQTVRARAHTVAQPALDNRIEGGANHNFTSETETDRFVMYYELWFVECFCIFDHFGEANWIL